MRSLMLGAWLVGLVVLAGAAASAVEVHPAGPAIPENLLRIELRFARPQRLPFDIHRVQLFDAAGARVQNAFLDLALPSADARRITVLMHPGRVKTGVGPQLALGRALHAGSAVRLVVEDPAGVPQAVVKEWMVTAAAPAGPQPALWDVRAPRAHTRDALIVWLRTPISSSAEGLIAVSDGAGRRVEGHAALREGDTAWHFTPQLPWRRGGHAVVAHPDLEDPAGNRACAAFEQHRASEIACDAGTAVPFEPVDAGRPRNPHHAPKAP